MRHLPPFAAVACLALWAAPALAEDGPPKLDIEATCKSATKAQVGTGDGANVDGCLRSEREAHAEIKKRWGDYTAAAKAQCSKQSQAGGFPSYVETVTCLELASGTAPSQTGGGEGASKAGRQGTSLTSEPSAAQRTNPIDVLEQK